MSPDRALWLALLDDAIGCAAGCAAALTYYEQQEARRWFADLADADVGTLRWVCALLDLDAAQVSRHVLAREWRALPAPRRWMATGKRAAILAALAAGQSCAAIARRLHVSPGTVRFYLRHGDRRAA